MFIIFSFFFFFGISSTFLDGDDLYDLEMIEKAYNLAEKNQSDLVLWDYQVFFDPSELKRINSKESELKELDVTNKIALLLYSIAVSYCFKKK